MAKSNFTDGVILRPEWVNSIQNLKFNKNAGQELFDGEYYRLENDALSNSPGSIKPDFYGFVNQFKVSVVSGLVVRYEAGNLITSAGVSTPYIGGNITLQPNRISYINIDEIGIVRASSELPPVCYPMAKVSTSGSSVNNIEDIRPFNAVQIRPNVSKILGGSGDEGDFVSNGNVTFKRGVYYYRNFRLNGGDTITIDKYAKIFVSANCIIYGNIDVNPCLAGGGSLSTLSLEGLNYGGLPGFGIGGGTGTVGDDDTYNWQTQNVGSGGSSGVITAIGSSRGGATALARGGTGGGGIEFEVGGRFALEGRIRANGSFGYSTSPGSNSVSSGGGGGSGGTIVVIAGESISIRANGGRIEANGGPGGAGRRGSGVSSSLKIAGGGGGGGGQAVLMAPDVEVETGASISLNGGSPGVASDGSTSQPGTTIGGGTGGSNGGSGGLYSLAGQDATLTVREIRPVG